MALLADLLQCPLYTSESGSKEEKAAILSDWIADQGQPVIAATSTLGIGVDYPHVRWVFNIDAPDKVTAFSQKSGRAGHDGVKASFIVMLSATWKPQRTRHCLRTRKPCSFI